MTDDNQVNIAGDTGSGLKLTCILQEGAVTISSAYGITGGKETVATYGSELEEGDYVMIDAGTYNTYDNTDGLPVVKAVAGAGPIVGRVVSTPELVGKLPSATKAYTNSSSADWGAILSGDYYRIATVEFFGVKQAIKARALGDGSNAIVAGAITTINYDVSDASWMYVASGGSGVINCHHVVATAAYYSTLLLVTGPALSTA